MKRTTTIQRRYSYGRYTNVPAIPRGMALKKYFFKQIYHPSEANFAFSAGGIGYTAGGNGVYGSGILYGPPTSPSGYFALRFTAADIPQIATFAALFDCYKISKLVVKLIPVVSQYTQGANSTAAVAAQPQWLSTVIDYDDFAVPTTEGELLQYQTFKQSHPNKLHKRVFTPAISMQAYKTGGTTIAYSQAKQKWLDAANTDVEHYGLKGLINGPANSATQVQSAWKVYVTAYISFKQVR